MGDKKAVRHTHKYARVTTPKGNAVWRCYRPECTHYMPEHQEFMLDGRNTICWKCDQTMVLRLNEDTPDKPICDECMGIVSESGMANISPALQALLKTKGVM